MKFTPGPWIVTYEFNVFSEKNRLVAACGGHASNVDSEKVHYENIANAYLTAAAPDMYEALKTLKVYIGEGSLPTRIAEKMRTALAKAEGGL